MNCNHATTLIGPYLDGELNEAQAGPLRRHLLACAGCRTGVQAHKDLRRWFVEPEPVVVPAGFAARVAQAAFAGGSRAEPAAEVPRDTPRVAAAAAPVEPAARGEGRLLRFVLGLTSVAAAATIMIVLFTRDNRLSEGAGLRADERPRLTMDQAVEELEALQRAEGAKAARR
ncbi:MAG: anti-sigma factor family protein [Planctomycetia bacterium]